MYCLTVIRQRITLFIREENSARRIKNRRKYFNMQNFRQIPVTGICQLWKEFMSLRFPMQEPVYDIFPCFQRGREGGAVFYVFPQV